MDLQKFKQTYECVISESADNSEELKNFIKSVVEEVLESTYEDEVEIEEETDPTKMSIRQLEKYIMDELTKHHKTMEPWTKELKRKQEIANKRKPDLWKGYTEPGKSGPDFGPRGPLG